MNELHEVDGVDTAGSRPVIVNNESGCGEVTVNVVNTSVTNNFSSPEWFNADNFKHLLDTIGGKNKI